MADKDRKDVTPDENRDPLTGTPGAHPVGVGVGAAAGGAALGAAGAALGAAATGAVAAGPIGAVVGAVVGGVAGGYAGKAVAEQIDPTTEEAYWRDTYSSRPYAESDVDYDQYQPAYRYGWESRAQHADRSWDDVEPDLERNWQSARAESRLAWDKARHATRDAWDRIDRRIKGGNEPERDRGAI